MNILWELSNVTLQFMEIIWDKFVKRTLNDFLRLLLIWCDRLNPNGDHELSAWCMMSANWAWKPTWSPCLLTTLTTAGGSWGASCVSMASSCCSTDAPCTTAACGDLRLCMALYWGDCVTFDNSFLAPAREGSGLGLAFWAASRVGGSAWAGSSAAAP